MLSGHGVPSFGAGRVRQALLDTADVLDAIETRTLALMNDGVPLDTALHEVEIPERLRQLPHLRPVYDHPQFLVRNVWRRDGGWYDGEPDNLLPATRAHQATGWGDARRRARSGVRPGPRAGRRRGPPPRLPPRGVAVLHDPASTEAHEVRAAVDDARSAAQESSVARNILGHAAHTSRQGRRDLAGRY